MMNTRSKMGFILHHSLLVLMIGAQVQGALAQEQAVPIKPMPRKPTSPDLSYAQARQYNEFQKLIEGLTERQLSAMKNDDPVLLEIYAKRMGGDAETYLSPWEKVVDADLFSRTDSWQVLSRLLATPMWKPNRQTLFIWLSRRPSFPGANKLLDQAVDLFRSGKLVGNDLFHFSYMVSVLGDEKHVVLFDELIQAGERTHNQHRKNKLLERLREQALQKSAPQAGAGKSMEHASEGSSQSAVPIQEFSYLTLWLTLGGFVLAACALAGWLIARTRGRGIRS